MKGVVVHPRVTERHPDITEEDVVMAWSNALAMRHRSFDPPVYLCAAGADTKGRVLEMVAVELEDGDVLVYHAMRITAKMAKELELS